MTSVASFVAGLAVASVMWGIGCWVLYRHAVRMIRSLGEWMDGEIGDMRRMMADRDEEGD